MNAILDLQLKVVFITVIVLLYFQLDDGKHSEHKCVTLDAHIAEVRKTIKPAISKIETNKQLAEDRIKSLNKEFKVASDRLRELQAKIQKVCYVTWPLPQIHCFR